MAKRVHKKIQATTGVAGSVFSEEQSEGYVNMLLKEGKGDRVNAMSEYLSMESLGRTAQLRRSGLGEADIARETSEWQDASNAVFCVRLLDEKKILAGEDLPLLERGLKEFDDASPSLREKAKTYHDVYHSLRRRLFPELYQS
jgi:hypothetical protein